MEKNLMYQGAAHYYFWKGIEAAVGNPEASLSGLKEILEVLCPVGGNVADNSRDSFTWGFLFGLEIDQEDFNAFFEVIEEPEQVILDDLGRNVLWN
jgi:hypothetical protein